MFFRIFRNSKNDINIHELYEIIKLNKECLLLDVRSPQEFLEGHLKGAINIPLYELSEKSNYKLKNKEEIIIVYCKSGIRSKKAIRILYRNGYKNLYNLKGGLDQNI